MSLTFKYSLTVTDQDIDDFRHVNNEIYLKWLIQAASAHSESLGYGLQKFLADGAAFVVRRHELDYLRPAFLDDELIVETWISTFEVVKSVREYRIIRKKDEKLILKGKTLWVYIDLETGKPKEIPLRMTEDYRRFLIL